MNREFYQRQHADMLNSRLDDFRFDIEENFNSSINQDRIEFFLHKISNFEILINTLTSFLGYCETKKLTEKLDNIIDVIIHKILGK